MGACPIDHSLDDVKKKLEEQYAFLPADLASQLAGRLTADLSQDALNDIFHLLKKYDLASASERKEREMKLAGYV